MELQRKFIRERETISIEQIEIILGIDSDAAAREFEFALSHFNTGSQELLMQHYCELRNLNAQEVFDCLHPPIQLCAELEAQRQDESIPLDLDVSPQIKEDGNTDHTKWSACRGEFVFHT